MTDLELLSEELATIGKPFPLDDPTGDRHWYRRHNGSPHGPSTGAALALGKYCRTARLSLKHAPATRRSVENEVRSHHFVLVDAKGKERASLVADDAGSVFLVMFDAAGKTRANLSVSNDGPSLVFYDASGRHARSWAAPRWSVHT